MAAKHEFMQEYAKRTGTDFPFTQQRTRSLFEAGIGPRGARPLHDSDLAAYFLGLLASPSHREAAEIVETIGRFSCVAIRGIGGDRERQALNALFPRLQVTPLRPFFASLIRGVADGRAPYAVGSLTAAWPPHSQVEISLLIRDAPATVLTFGPGLPVAARLRRKERTRPVKITHELDGGVISELVYLSTPDED